MLAHLPIACIGLTGILGASTLIGLVADLLSILTLPFFACYVVAAFTFRQSFSMLHALFDVFRGGQSCAQSPPWRRSTSLNLPQQAASSTR
jgi:hypothetical protein